MKKLLLTLSILTMSTNIFCMKHKNLMPTQQKITKSQMLDNALEAFKKDTKITTKFSHKYNSNILKTDDLKKEATIYNIVVKLDKKNNFTMITIEHFPGRTREETDEKYKSWKDGRVMAFNIKKEDLDNKELASKIKKLIKRMKGEEETPEIHKKILEERKLYDTTIITES